jgi:hypothetical protein
MPPQQIERLLDVGSQGLHFRAHGFSPEPFLPVTPA